MPCPEGFQLFSTGTFWWKIFRDYTGITFYPTCLYHGMTVSPVMWHTESTEPIVKCLASWGMGGSGFTDEYREHIRQHGEPNEYNNLLVSDGWQVEGQVEYTKYIHVDELDKIEGPPPDGAF